MSSTIRTLVLLLILVVLLGAAYFTFFKKDESTLLESGVSNKEKVELETKALLSQLQDLKQIEINQDFFSDPRFLSLENFRQQLTDEPSGRSNPFAPVR